MTEQKPQEPNTDKENSVASSSDKGETSGESKPLWRVPFNYIASLSNDERIRLVTAITIAFLLLLGGMVVTLLILVQFFDIKKDKDGIYVSSKSSPVVKALSTPNNPSKVEPSEKLTPDVPANSPSKVEPSGKLTPDVLLYFRKQAVEEDVFRRDWIGPDGEEISSKDLDPCLLVPGHSGQPRWGQLLAQVMKKPGSARHDPFQTLANNGLKPEDLKLVSERNHLTLKAHDDGFLTFIINEAVFANPSNYKLESYPQPENCKRGYEALDAASSDLREQSLNDYVIHRGSIPLVWYSDNIGSFQVIVKNSKSKELKAYVIVQSTAGFQNSGIYLKAGDEVILEPDGRVHLALRQVHTFMGSIKAIIEREKAKI